MVSARMARFAAPLLAASALALLLAAPVLGSDHQDTPEVELNSRCDINDVYAFPNPADPSRICLIMTTSSPISSLDKPSASFDPDKLYQIKIDNNGDAREDRVFQFTFDGSGTSQTVNVRGPVAPVSGYVGVRNKLSADPVTLNGGINSTLGSPTGLQVFCGVKDDPFFIDLERFFALVPDRRPSRGQLSVLQAPATGWRDPGFDFLAPYYCLAIAVELPKAALTDGASSQIGVWGTVSR